MSLISILIPNYNHARYLPRCLDSIFAQEHSGVEVIVCDDGSTDQSLEILRAYQVGRPSLKLMQNPQNQGVMATLNKLYGAATGDYLLGLGADDQVGEGYLTLLKSVLEQYRPALVFSDIRVDIIDFQSSESITFGSAAGLWSCQDFVDRYRQFPYGVGGCTVHRADLLRQHLATAEQLGPLFDFWINHAIAFMHGGYYIPGEFSRFTAYAGSYGARARNRQVYRKFLDCLAQPENRSLRECYRQSTILRMHGSVALWELLISRRDHDLLTLAHFLNALKTWTLTPLRRYFPKMYGRIRGFFHSK